MRTQWLQIQKREAVMKKKVFICILVLVLAAVLTVAWLEIEPMDIVETEVHTEIKEETADIEILTELPRMVMVDGVLYKDTGMGSHVLKCGVMDGEITSSVSEGEQPVKDNQSNFGKGYGYQRGFVEGRIEVSIDGECCVFSKEEVDWGITLSAQDETSTGVVILCTQAGGNPTGTLQTGGYYILETFQDGVWKEAPCFAEVAWTMEAWVISPDSTAKWEVDWEWLYGELSPGIYRIGKRFLDFRNTGNYDSKMIYAEFTIED
jgi:hypothetical protein